MTPWPWAPGSSQGKLSLAVPSEPVDSRCEQSKTQPCLQRTLGVSEGGGDEFSGSPGWPVAPCPLRAVRGRWERSRSQLGVRHFQGQFCPQRGSLFPLWGQPCAHHNLLLSFSLLLFI